MVFGHWVQNDVIDPTSMTRTRILFHPDKLSSHVSFRSEGVVVFEDENNVRTILISGMKILAKEDFFVTLFSC